MKLGHVKIDGYLTQDRGVVVDQSVIGALILLVRGQMHNGPCA